MTESLDAAGRPTLRDWLTRHAGELDGVVLDIDGVLVRHRRALPGAVELLARLDTMGLPHNLLTNDSCHSPTEKTAYLRDSGVVVDPGRICSAGHALRRPVVSMGLEGALFFTLGSLGIPDYGVEAGLRVTRDLEAAENGACRGVLVGEQGYDWEPAINAAINYLVREPAGILLCPNPDLYHPVRADRIHLSSGAVAHLVRDMVVSYGVPCEPIYLGKPHEPVFAMNHERLERARGREIPRARVLMVGDSLAGDIAGARAFGYRSALVFTGLTTPRLLEASPVKPDLVLAGL